MSLSEGEIYISTRLKAACMDLKVAAELMYLDGHGTEALMLESHLDAIKDIKYRVYGDEV